MQSRIEKVDELKSALWHTNFRGITTTNACPSEGCNGRGRFGGPCRDCIEKELAGYVGAELARAYHESIKTVRLIEAGIDAKIEAVWPEE